MYTIDKSHITEDETAKKEQNKAVKAKHFEDYMIHIGQWEIINGQVNLKKSADFISKERLESGFKSWLKSKK